MLPFGPQEISLYHAVHEVNYWHQYQRYDESSELGADYIFVDHPCFRRAGGLYHNQAGEYGDNLFRFALLSLAAAVPHDALAAFSRHSRLSFKS